MPPRPLEALGRWAFDRGLKLLFLLSIYADGFALDAWTAAQIMENDYGFKARVSFTLLVTRLFRRFGLLEKINKKQLRITPKGREVYGQLVGELEKNLARLKSRGRALTETEGHFGH